VVILQSDIEERLLPLESGNEALHFSLLKGPFQGLADFFDPATDLQLGLDDFYGLVELIDRPTCNSKGSNCLAPCVRITLCVIFQLK